MEFLKVKEHSQQRHEVGGDFFSFMVVLREPGTWEHVVSSPFPASHAHSENIWSKVGSQAFSRS